MHPNRVAQQQCGDCGNTRDKGNRAISAKAWRSWAHIKSMEITGLTIMDGEQEADEDFPGAMIFWSQISHHYNYMSSYLRLVLMENLLEETWDVTCSILKLKFWQNSGWRNKNREIIFAKWKSTTTTWTNYAETRRSLIIYATIRSISINLQSIKIMIFQLILIIPD
jgi:hypothetical protein